MTTDPHLALIFTTVLAAVSDGAMSDNEMRRLGLLVSFLPAFRGFDSARIEPLTEECVRLLADENGLDMALDVIAESLPETHYETAYAIACDVIAADARASQEELRLLEMLRDRLSIGRLEAAAIERGARARSRRFD